MRTIGTIRHPARRLDETQRHADRIPGRRLIAAGWAWFSRQTEKRRSRVALSELTDGQLADIGLTRAQARIEFSRPFWD